MRFLHAIKAESTYRHSKRDGDPPCIHSPSLRHVTSKNTNGCVTVCNTCGLGEVMDMTRLVTGGIGGMWVWANVQRMKDVNYRRELDFNLNRQARLSTVTWFNRIII